MTKYPIKKILAFWLLLAIIVFSFGCSSLNTPNDDVSSSQTVDNSESQSLQQTSNTNLSTEAQIDKTTDASTETTGTTTSVTQGTSPSTPKTPSNVDVASAGVKLRFIFSDRDGVPVQNLKVEISPIDDIKSDYTPYFSTSDMSGCSTGEAVLGNYRVIVRDADETTVYSEMMFDLVVSAYKTDYNFVWENITPQERLTSNGSSIRFMITADGAPLTNASIVLYVGHHEVHDFWTTNHPETIELGTTDVDGVAVWSAPKSGKYTLYTYITKDGQKTKVAKQFVVDDIPGDFKIDF